MRARFVCGNGLQRFTVSLRGEPAPRCRAHVLRRGQVRRSPAPRRMRSGLGCVPVCATGNQARNRRRTPTVAVLEIAHLRSDGDVRQAFECINGTLSNPCTKGHGSPRKNAEQRVRITDVLYLEFPCWRYWLRLPRIANDAHQRRRGVQPTDGQPSPTKGPTEVSKLDGGEFGPRAN
jgi:hypothetical protein